MSDEITCTPAALLMLGGTKDGEHGCPFSSCHCPRRALGSMCGHFSTHNHSFVIPPHPHQYRCRW